MEKRDLMLIEKYRSNDEVLSNLYNEHLDFEKKIEEIEKKEVLTPEDEIVIKQLKKEKLQGRDQMEQILRKYRDSASV